MQQEILNGSRMSGSRLYIVATPIGNLGDLSPRALECLQQVDIVAAEDTRHTRRLLRAHDIARGLLALHEHNEAALAEQLTDKLLGGQSIALVSDAGTPLLSDPGYRLVSTAAAAGVEIVAVPGPSAVTAALSISGLPTDRFCFEGFLPARSAARRKALQGLQAESRTLVFFESGHRIVDCLKDMVFVLGANRAAAVCREMTKQFETVLRGDLESCLQQVSEDHHQQKGEFALVLAGHSQPAGAGLQDAVRLAHELCSLVTPSQAARVAARIHGVARRDVYRALEKESEGSGVDLGAE